MKQILDDTNPIVVHVIPNNYGFNSVRFFRQVKPSIEEIKEQNHTDLRLN